MPDLNSVPKSPRAGLENARRRSSTTMSSAAVPSSPSLNILPSNQNAVNQGQALSSLPSPQQPSSQHSTHHHSHHGSIGGGEMAFGSGPGPLRHPRPLTAADLHLQLEKEQEAVVNRLTRELSLLRAAQNASVVSNTSSTSAATSTQELNAESSLLAGSGFTIPTGRRHHRTSSAASHGPAQFISSSYEGRSHRPQPLSLSRQNSAASKRSRTNSPGPQSALDPLSYFQHHRIPPPTSVPVSSAGATPGSHSVSEQLNPGLMPATQRYEETQFYRNELENAKRDNEMLKRRIRELEKQMREKRASSVSRTRSDSVSTTASLSVTPSGGASIAGPRESIPIRPGGDRERGTTAQSVVSVAGSIGVGVSEEEVKVGESAASRVGSAQH